MFKELLQEKSWILACSHATTFQLIVFHLKKKAMWIIADVLYTAGWSNTAKYFCGTEWVEFLLK